jgi:hypothetical protein
MIRLLKSNSFLPATGELVALKQMKYKENSVGIDSSILREIAFHKELKHENILE